MTEKKYIGLDDAIDALCYFDGKSLTGRTAQEIVKEIPAADVRPVVRGKWVWKTNGEVVCSKCNDLIAVVANTDDLVTVKFGHNFCPNCGADMREES